MVCVFICSHVISLSFKSFMTVPSNLVTNYYPSSLGSLQSIRGVRDSRYTKTKVGVCECQNHRIRGTSDQFQYYLVKEIFATNISLIAPRWCVDCLEI